MSLFAENFASYLKSLPMWQCQIRLGGWIKTFNCSLGYSKSENL